MRELIPDPAWKACVDDWPAEIQARVAHDFAAEGLRLLTEACDVMRASPGTGAALAVEFEEVERQRIAVTAAFYADALLFEAALDAIAQEAPVVQ